MRVAQGGHSCGTRAELFGPSLSCGMGKSIFCGSLVNHLSPQVKMSVKTGNTILPIVPWMKAAYGVRSNRAALVVTRNRGVAELRSLLLSVSLSLCLFVSALSLSVSVYHSPLCPLPPHPFRPPRSLSLSLSLPPSLLPQKTPILRLIRWMRQISTA